MSPEIQNMIDNSLAGFSEENSFNEYARRIAWDRQRYWLLNETGEWKKLDKDSLTESLEVYGAFRWTGAVTGKDEKAAAKRAFEKRLRTAARDQNEICFVGQMAGYQKGIHVHKGDKYLCTKGYSLIKPENREFPTIQGLLMQLFGEEQIHYLHSWLKGAYESLEAGEKRAGQVLIIAGVPDIGKSFIKEFIIRRILGGRYCEPGPCLQGLTRFNSDLAENESWELDDSVGVSGTDQRNLYGSAFKKLAANSDHRVEAKGRDAAQLPPLFHRLSIYTNVDNASLWVIPALTEGSLADKAIVLKAEKPENPIVKLPSPEERPAFREKVSEELPGYVNWLTSEYETPKHIKNNRYGVKAYQHPELKGQLEAMSDEGRLRSMIDDLIFESGRAKKTWEGTGGELEKQLRIAAREDLRDKDLEKILRYSQAFVQLLSKLKGKGVEKKRMWDGPNRGKRVWVVQAPEEWGAPELDLKDGE